MEPTKQEISQVFKRLRASGPNKVCFDCGTKNPTWASVTYGVFICINCSAVHRSLGVHISFVRSTQLDSWTWVQLRAMQVGGNSAATAYFHSHGCSAREPHAKYNSRAANMYRDKLYNLAVSTQKTYGTQLFFDLNDPMSPTATDDFFSTISTPTKSESEMSNLSLELARVSVSQSSPQKPTTANNMPIPGDSDVTRQPSVDTLISEHTVQPAKTDRSSLINKRKTTTKPSLSGGLGAQKVNRSFSEIEKQAEDKQKSQEEQRIALAAESKGKLSSDKSDFTYHVDRQKMASLDPVKAKQAERLGMGLSRASTAPSSSGHSAFNSMDTIDQVNPTKVSSYKDSRYSNHSSHHSSHPSTLFDEYDLDEPSSRFDSDYPSRYERSSYSGGIGKKQSSSEPKFSSHSAFGSQAPARHSRPDPVPTTTTGGYSGYKGHKRTSPPSESSTTAQDRFANSKSISSDQFFNRTGSDVDPNDTTAEFNRFSSSKSISSDDYFGRTPKAQSNTDSVSSVVSKIAGAANGVWGSFQDQYQHYTHKY